MSSVASPIRASWWWGFGLYSLVSVIHVIGTFWPDWPGDTLTKLMLIPALMVGVLWAWRSGARLNTTVLAVLLIALAFSWLGDGARTFVPMLPTLPVMLASFGITHLLYIWVFWRRLAVRRPPFWTLVYVVWWLTLVLVLLPHLGSLAIAVAVYGIVLGCTATAAARCNPTITLGAVLFLASDSVLAFRLFLPELMPAWTSALVMATYCAGQGLIALGILRSDSN